MAVPVFAAAVMLLPFSALAREDVDLLTFDRAMTIIPAPEQDSPPLDLTPRVLKKTGRIAMPASQKSARATPRQPSALPPLTLTPEPAIQQEPPVKSGQNLSITVEGESDLSGVFPVSADGTILFPLLGPLPVQGSTPSQVAGIVTHALKNGYLVEPRVTVSIAAP